MERENNVEDVLTLGAWIGRNQAFSLMAGRCTVAEIECLVEVHDKKLYAAVAATWDAYCEKLGIHRTTADRLMRRHKQQGPRIARLNCFARIKPAEYSLFAAVLTDEGLVYQGEVIPVEAENAPRLAQAVEAIRQEAKPEPVPVDRAAESFAKAERSLQTALAEFSRLQSMDLGREGRLKLLVTVEAGRDSLDRIRLSTSL